MSCICGELLDTGKRGKKKIEIGSMKNCEWLIYGFWSFVSVDTKRGKKTRLNKLGFQKLLGKVGREGMLHHQNSCWCWSEKTARESRSCLTVWLHPTVLPKRSCRGAEPWSDGGGSTDFKQLTSNSHTMSHSIIQESYRNHTGIIQSFWEKLLYQRPIIVSRSYF